ncbi:MAG: sensor domain-containing diguanylate cyclase [Thermomicrobiales bacterium]
MSRSHPATPAESNPMASPPADDALRSRTAARAQIDAWLAIHAREIVSAMLAEVQPFTPEDASVSSLRRLLEGHFGIICSAIATLPSKPLHLRGIGKAIAQGCNGHPTALANLGRALRRSVLGAMPAPMAASIEPAFEYILAEIAWGFAVAGEEIEQGRQHTPLRQDDSTFALATDWLIAAADQCPFAVAIFDLSLGRLTAANPALTQLFGYSLEEFDRLSDAELLGPESPDEDGDVFIKLAAGVVTHVRRISAFRHKDGHMVWFEMVAWLIHDADGEPVRIVYAYSPQDELLGVGGHWQRAEARFRHLSQLSPDPILLVSPERTIVYASPAIAQTLGIDPEEAPGMPFEELVLESDHPQIEHLFDGGLDRARTLVRQRVRMQRRDGEWRWFELSSVNMLDVPNLGAFSVQVRDISDRIAVEAILARQAMMDELTGLPNRRAAVEYIDAALAREETGDDARRLCVMFIDLNRFKTVNDRYGHEVGDCVLAEIGNRLLVELQKHLFVARFGGDEFIACLEQTTATRARRVAERLMRRIAEPMVIGGTEHAISAEVGLVMSGPEVHDAAALIRAADRALYIAKATREGKPVMVSSRPELDDEDSRAQLAGA